jgi:hypothetical protein
LGPHKHTVGGQIAHAGANAIAQAIARSEHDDQHKNTPENTKGGKKRPHFVFFQCAEYFSVAVRIEESHIFSDIFLAYFTLPVK